ncbi:energy-dependent translational throttle protein EttA [Candidatus Riflebacteria bacterium]
MAGEYVFSLKGLGKVYPPKKQILKDIYLSFFHGAKIGVLGLNGTGKSSLLRIMAGEDREIIGEANPKKGLKIGFLPQEPALDMEKTVKEVVIEGIGESYANLIKYEEINDRFEDDLSGEELDKLLEEQARLQEKIDLCNGWELEHKLNIAMDALRLPQKESLVKNISGGEKRRVALCRLLLQSPELLLLDEPTNHLDAESVAWLERYLSEYTGTVVAITHDRYFLDNIAGWILELDRGTGYPFEGNYSQWLEQKEKRLAVEEKSKSLRRKTLERELEWIRMTPKAKHAKSKARIKAFENMLSMESEQKIEDLEIYIPSGPRLGQKVIEVNNISKSYGEKCLFDDLSFVIPRGAVVGIIGGNGAGKTTLFRMLTGQEKPDSGSIVIGETVKMGYVDQERGSLDPDKTIWEEITTGKDIIMLGDKEMNSRAYIARFNFLGTDQQKKVGIMSGGERNRLNLAKVLAENANVLLLDEPTNDLDVNTLSALEAGIEAFAGCALIISHDRWFLNRVCNFTIAFEGDSVVNFFAGNFAEYEEDKLKRLGKDALIPKRIKYKKLNIQ